MVQATIKGTAAVSAKDVLFRYWKISGVGAQGSWGLLVGGGDRLGQVHGDSVADGTPELVHCAGLVMGLSLAGGVVTVSQEPTCWY